MGSQSKIIRGFRELRAIKTHPAHNVTESIFGFVSRFDECVAVTHE